MFLVFNKQKIASYLIAFSTVVLLFMVAFATTNQQNTVVTSANQVEKPISCIQTEESYQANNSIDTQN
ncbi:MAG: hypothetical protein IJ777_02465 [Clostridia bacterium]|nr:hypothetical protein [Clostridia bacterium]